MKMAESQRIEYQMIRDEDKRLRDADRRVIQLLEARVQGRADRRRNLILVVVVSVIATLAMQFLLSGTSLTFFH